MTETARILRAVQTEGVILTRSVMLAALLQEGVVHKGYAAPFIASVTDYFGISLQFDDEVTFRSWASWLGADEVSTGHVTDGRMHYASTCEYAGEHVALAWVQPRK